MIIFLCDDHSMIIITDQKIHKFNFIDMANHIIEHNTEKIIRVNF